MHHTCPYTKNMSMHLGIYMGEEAERGEAFRMRPAYQGLGYPLQ